GDFRESRHRPVDAVAEAFAFGAEVVCARAAHHAFAADVRRGFRNDAVAFFKAANSAALFRHDAAELVAEHDGRGHAPALRPVVLMHVAAADAHRPDLQQDLVFADFWDRHFAQLHRTRLQIELHYGGH